MRFFTIYMLSSIGYRPCSKAIIVFGVCFFTGTIVVSQEMFQVQSYMYNQFIYNPAAGGMYETDFNAQTASRLQWSGTEGAPVTNCAWLDHRFKKNAMSTGLVILNDQIGATRTSEIAANYTYILRLSKTLKFSMGLRAGYTSFTYDVSNIDRIWQAGDPLAQSYADNYPKFGTGFQLYNRQFYLSLGLPDLVALKNSKFVPDANENFFNKHRNYQLMAGYRVKISDGFSLFPNARLFYFAGNASVARADATLLGEITDYFWAGASYSTSNNAAFMAGTFVSSRVRLMYAYEFVAGKQTEGPVRLAVHEISLMLRMDDLFTRKNKAEVD